MASAMKPRSLPARYPERLMGGQGIIDCNFGKLRSRDYGVAGLGPLSGWGMSATV